jgi:hypothetical protein
MWLIVNKSLGWRLDPNNGDYLGRWPSFDSSTDYHGLHTVWSGWGFDRRNHIFLVNNLVNNREGTAVVHSDNISLLVSKTGVHQQSKAENPQNTHREWLHGKLQCKSRKPVKRRLS